MRGAVALVCAGLAATPAIAASGIVGSWFGQGQPHDKVSMYLDKFRADGTFHSDFRDCRGPKARDSNEDGTWTLMGDILTLQIQLRNGAFAPHTEIYRMNSITPQAFKDVYEGLDFPYDEHRVDAKFRMPDCQLVS